MKVLMLSPLPPPEGGIATWTKKFLNHAHSLEIKVDIVNEAHIGKSSKRIVKRINAFEEIARTTKILVQTAIKMSLHKYQIMHINSSCGNGLIRDYFAAKIGKFYGAKILLHCHCNVADQIQKSRIAKMYFPKITKISDNIFVLNSNSFEVAQKYNNNITLLPNFIEKDNISSSHTIRQTVKSVFFCGRVSKAKGSFEIFEAAHKFPNIKFILAGMVDNDIIPRQLSGNIKFLGQICNSDIIKYLDSADIFLFPSYSEGFSVSLLEAMARGVPCIASNVGANKDMLEDGGGIILKEITGDEIASAIYEMSNIETRRLASDWNIKKVLNNYTLDIIIKQIMWNYNKMLDVFPNITD